VRARSFEWSPRQGKKQRRSANVCRYRGRTFTHPGRWDGTNDAASAPALVSLLLEDGLDMVNAERDEQFRRRISTRGKSARQRGSDGTRQAYYRRS